MIHRLALTKRSHNRTATTLRFHCNQWRESIDPLDKRKKRLFFLHELYAAVCSTEKDQYFVKFNLWIYRK